MQVISPHSQTNRSLGRTLGYFLIPPIVTLALVVLLLATGMALYRASHSGRVYTGVTIQGIDVGGLTPEEAATALRDAAPYSSSGQLTLVDPRTGQEWSFTPAQLGIVVDTEATAEVAFDVGRSGGPLHRLQDTFQSWYYGRTIAPIVVFDEGQLDRGLGAISAEIERDAISAAWSTNEAGTPVYSAGQIGRTIDRDYLREELQRPISSFSDARVELLTHDIYPATYDNPEIAARLQRTIASPVTFYFQEPLDDLDLTGVTLPQEELAKWIRVEEVTSADGRTEHLLTVD